METKETARRITPNYNYISQKIRNIVETVIFDLIIVVIIINMHLGFKGSAYALLILIPVTVISYIGINEQSLVTALINIIKFRKNRRVLGKPTAEYVRKKDKALLKKQQKEMKSKRGGK